MAILDDKAVEARLHQFSFIDNVNSASSSQLLDVWPVDVTNGQTVDADIVRNPVILTFDLQSRSFRQRLFPRVYDFKIPHDKVFWIEDAGSIKRSVISHNARLRQFLISIRSNNNWLSRCSFRTDFKFSIKSRSTLQQQLFARSQREVLYFF